MARHRLSSRSVTSPLQLRRRVSMWNLIQHMTTSWVDETIRLCDGFRRGESDPFPTWEDPPPVTPFEVVAQYGKLRLRHYRAKGTAHPTPLLLIYALVKRPFILALQPERSVISTLTANGLTVYLTDLIAPTAADTWRGFDAYVNQDLVRAVRFIQEKERTAQMTLMGYCLGGLLGAMYAALHPQTIKHFV